MVRALPVRKREKIDDIDEYIETKGGNLIKLWGRMGVSAFNTDPQVNSDFDLAVYTDGLKSAKRRGTLSVVREILKERGVKV